MIYFFPCSDHYIVGVSWVDKKILNVVWMNRKQNLSLVVHCQEESKDEKWECKEVRPKLTDSCIMSNSLCFFKSFLLSSFRNGNFFLLKRIVKRTFICLEADDGIQKIKEKWKKSFFLNTDRQSLNV